MKLIGLDFETANHRNGSICAVGLALVNNGTVTDKREWLIRPHHTMDWVLPQFTEIHGINYYQLRKRPQFGEIWAEMAEFITKGELVVIHNAQFDLRHLLSALKLYNAKAFSFHYLCSLHLSRQLFPEMPSHSLDKMAEKFEIDFVYHNALADAATCAVITSQCDFPEKFIRQFDFSPTTR